MAAIDPETMKELGLTERDGFAVYDWSTSSTFWKFNVRPVKYLIDGAGKLWPQTGKALSAPEVPVTFETLENIIFLDAESARTAAAKVASDNGRECNIDVDEG